MSNQLTSGGASENYLGQIGSKSVRPTDNFTRPSDATAYAAGDVVSDSTSAPTAAYLTWSSAARNNGGGGTIVGVRMVDSANQSTAGSFELWLFHTAVTIDNDNAVFTPTDAECATFVGVIPLDSNFVGDATSGAGGNRVYRADKSYLPVHFTCATSDTALYGVLVVRNSYTPVSAENFVLELEIVQD